MEMAAYSDVEVNKVITVMKTFFHWLTVTGVAATLGLATTSCPSVVSSCSIDSVCTSHRRRKQI